MKEQLITFETAKLAKEKGFNIKPEDFYSIDYYCIKSFTNDWKDSISFIKEGEVIEGYYLSPLKDEANIIIQAPTQSLLQKWLREKCSLIVTVTHEVFSVASEDGWYFTIRDYASHQKFLRGKSDTYEEALEKGLQEALKLI